jgi:uncharacterized protein
MEICIDSLKIRPRKLVFDEPLENFPVLRELAEKGELTLLGSIGAELVVTLVGTLVEVEGKLFCRVVFPCSRCLTPVEQQLDLTVALSFSRQAATPTEASGELELTEDQVGLIPFEGDVIDLRLPLEQELLMSLPQHPLCNDNCAGLCPVCGADRNRNECNCDPPVFHGGFAALKSLKTTK